MLKTNKAGELVLGNVTATGTQNCGLPVEYWADRAMERIIRISEDPLYPSPIKDQALMFKDALRQVIERYMKQAIRSDRTTLYNLFVQQGHQDMAEILRRL